MALAEILYFFIGITTGTVIVLEEVTAVNFTLPYKNFRELTVNKSIYVVEALLNVD